MVARIQKLIALMVISLTVAVISLPMTADAVATRPVVQVLTPVTEVVRTPVRVATVSDGGFYVTDPRNSGVLRYDSSGKLIQVIRTSGVPQGVAVMQSGDLVVTQGATVSVIDRVTGLQIKQLGSGFGFADGVAVDDVGSIYIVDSKNCTVNKFDANGVAQAGFGSQGVGNGQFMMPGAIVFEKSSGYLAITDAGLMPGASVATYTSRVQFFDKTGTFMKSVGSFGSAGALTFTSPQGIAFEYTSGGTLSRMYVIDTYNSVVEVIGEPTTVPVFLGFVGQYGTDETKGQMILPTDVAFDSVNKRLVVANGNGNMVLFGIDGGSTPASQYVIPPALTLNDPYTIVNTPSVQLSGTVTPGSVVSCVLNGVPVTPALNVVGSTWSYTVPGLNPGSNDIVVTARNLFPTSDSKSVTVSFVAAGPSLYVNSVPVYVKTPTLPLSGTVTAGSTVSVCTPEATCTPATVSGTNWSYTPGVNLSTTAVTEIFVKAANGGETLWPKITTRLDTVAPVVTLSAVNNAATVSGQIQNVTGVVSDALSGVATVKVNGTLVQVNNGVFSFPLSGVTSYTVEVIDLAGNNVSSTRTIVYDPSKATIAVASHADGAVLASAGQTIIGTASTTSTVTIGGTTVTPAGTGPYSWQIPVTLSTGMNDIQIVLGDGSRTKLTLFLDTAKPEVAVAVPAIDKASNVASYSIDGVAAAGVALTSSVNGFEPTVRQSEVLFPVNFTVEGIYSVKIAATDQAGNVSYSVRNLVYDITPPALTVNLASAPTSTLSGTVEPGATVVVKDNATQVTLGTVAYTGSSSWSAALGSSKDPFTLYVAATDAAGNTVSKFSIKADGNINLDEQVSDLSDALFCMDLVVSNGPKVVQPIVSPLQLAHGDIAPIVNGLSRPDGAIDLLDCLIILRKSSGLSVSW